LLGVGKRTKDIWFGTAKKKKPNDSYVHVLAYRSTCFYLLGVGKRTKDIWFGKEKKKKPNDSYVHVLPTVPLVFIRGLPVT
jgi:hypothetical protein